MRENCTSGDNGGWHPVRGAFYPLTKGWPKQLDNIWLQNLLFLGVAIFSGVILTRPKATGAVLSSFILAAIVFSLIYGKRVFCRYICPVGGFIGLYSLVAPLEVRVKDKEVCRKHQTKNCIMGTEEGYGCPWMEVPWTMERNLYCGMCNECFRTCDQDNITLNLKPFGTDLLVQKGKGLDEAYKGIIMLTCAIAYSIVFQGPWGFIKDSANLAIPGFFFYAVSFILLNILIAPTIFALFVWLSKGIGGGKMPPFKDLLVPFINLAQIAGKLAGRGSGEVPSETDETGLPRVQRLFVDLSYVLIPMGLGGWMAFSISFLFINGAYILRVISDPFGWGWNLLGTAKIEWHPVLVGVLPYLQSFILIAGLMWSISVAHKLIRKYGLAKAATIKALIPIALFLMLVTGTFLWLYV